MDSTKFYIHFRAYQNKDNDYFGNLKTPDISFYNYVEILENNFVKNFNKYAGGKNVGVNIFNMLKCIPFSHPCINFPAEYMLKLFVRVRIFYTLKFINRNFEGALGKNRKIIKITHL